MDTSSRVSSLLFLWIVAVVVLVKAKKNPCVDYADCLNAEQVTTMPTCRSGEKTRLMSCAENNLEQAKDCKGFVLRSLRQFVSGVGLAEKTFCEDDKLKKEFEENQVCWKSAANCASNFGDTAALPANECKFMVNSINECSSKIKHHECKPLQTRFVDNLMGKLTCHRNSASSSSSTSLTSLLIAPILNRLRGG